MGTDLQRQPGFGRVAIVGVGLIGASIALAVRRTRPHTIVIGVDCQPGVVAEALASRVIHAGSTDLAAVAGADLVVLAAPVRANVAVLPAVARHAPGRVVVTDVGSTKRVVVDSARTCTPRPAFVGGHPLAGAASGGLAGARADLFAGRKWVFTPDEDACGEVLERLFAFVAGLGAIPCTMTAAEHDRLLAVVSHLPQIVSSALMHVVGELGGDEGLAVAGTGLADMTRLASSPVEIWRDIFLTNADNVRPTLARLAGVLADLADPVDGTGKLDDIFRSARAWREERQSRLPSSAGDLRAKGLDGARRR